MLTPLTVKYEFSKNVKSFNFLMVKGPMNPNITALGEKLLNKNLLVLYKEKIEKCP